MHRDCPSSVLAGGARRAASTSVGLGMQHAHTVTRAGKCRRGVAQRAAARSAAGQAGRWAAPAARPARRVDVVACAA